MAVVDWRYMDALQVLDSFVPETPERRRERAQALFLSMNEQLTDQERRILQTRQATVSSSPAMRAGFTPALEENNAPNEETSSAALDRMTKEALRLIGEAKESLGALVNSLCDEDTQSNNAKRADRRDDRQMRDLVTKALGRVAESRGMTIVLGPRDTEAKVLADDQGTKPQATAKLRASKRIHLKAPRTKR